MADTPDVETLKRKGRRRLVGAIALVLVAVVFVALVGIGYLIGRTMGEQRESERRGVLRLISSAKVPRTTHAYCIAFRQFRRSRPRELFDVERGQYS